MRFRVVSSNHMASTVSRGWMSAEEALEVIMRGSGNAQAENQDGTKFSQEDLEAYIAAGED